MNMDVIHIDKESSKRPAANSYRQLQSSYELGKIGEKDKDVITCFKENASPSARPLLGWSSKYRCSTFSKNSSCTSRRLLSAAKSAKDLHVSERLRPFHRFGGIQRYFPKRWRRWICEAQNHITLALYGPQPAKAKTFNLFLLNVALVTHPQYFTICIQPAFSGPGGILTPRTHNRLHRRRRPHQDMPPPHDKVAAVDIVKN